MTRSNKNPIAWHRDAITNMERYVQAAEGELARHAERVKKLKSSLRFRQKQLAEAVRRGLDSYDQDRDMLTEEKVRTRRQAGWSRYAQPCPICRKRP